MSALNQRWMAMGGIVSMVILLLGMWVIAGFVPPPGPNLSMDQIVRIYVEDNVRIKIGIIIACAGVTLLAPWSAAIAIQMRRIEGELPPLALSQALLGLLLLVEFYIPCIMWEAAGRASPVFPRRVGYFSLWAAVCFLPGGLNCLAKTGVLAWNGLLAWWLGLAVFGGWIFVVSVCLLKYAIPHQIAEAAQVGFEGTAAPANGTGRGDVPVEDSVRHST